MGEGKEKGSFRNNNNKKIPQNPLIFLFSIIKMSHGFSLFPAFWEMTDVLMLMALCTVTVWFLVLFMVCER